VHPAQPSLAQNLDGVGRFEEMQARGEATPPVYPHINILFEVRKETRTANEVSQRLKNGFRTVMLICPHAAKIRLTASPTTALPTITVLAHTFEEVIPEHAFRI
jgi:hypothetical protein